MDEYEVPKKPTDLIDSTKYRACIKTDKDLAARMGMLRQTLSHKRKFPGTFTGYEVCDLAKLLDWKDKEIAAFIRGIR